MDYSYEIKKMLPKHELMTVVYKADGYPDYVRNFNPRSWDEETITSLIEGGAQLVVEFWERHKSHPETVSIATTGSATFVPPVVEEVDFNHVPTPEPLPDFNPVYQYCVPKQIENPMQETVGWDVITIPAEDISDFIRGYRNIALSETDTFALSDRIMSDEMRTYRQALRDLPQQPNFPGSLDNPITIPTKPPELQ